MDTYYNCYLEILNMLCIRETITEEKKKELYLTPHAFSMKYNSNISNIDIPNLINRNGIPTYVLFHKDDLTINKTNDIFMNLLESRLTATEIETHNIIIVFPLMQNASSGISTSVPYDLYKREKKILKEKGISVQFFTTYYASIPILKHVLMPEFKIITDEAKKDEILSMSKAKNMNIILASDPVVRYFGAKNNDIFQVTRKGKESLQVIWRHVQEI